MIGLKIHRDTQKKKKKRLLSKHKIGENPCHYLSWSFDRCLSIHATKLSITKPYETSDKEIQDYLRGSTRRYVKLQTMQKF